MVVETHDLEEFRSPQIGRGRTHGARPLREQSFTGFRPEPTFDPKLYPRTYRVQAGWMVFHVLLGAALAIGGALGAWYFGAGHEMRSALERVLFSGGSALFGFLGI